MRIIDKNVGKNCDGAYQSNQYYRCRKSVEITDLTRKRRSGVRERLIYEHHKHSKACAI